MGTTALVYPLVVLASALLARVRKIRPGDDSSMGQRI